MTNVTMIYGDRQPRLPIATAPRRKAPKASAADIERALKVAAAAGLTIYGFSVVGGEVHVRTKPIDTPPTSPSTEAEAWFASRG